MCLSRPSAAVLAFCPYRRRPVPSRPVSSVDSYFASNPSRTSTHSLGTPLEQCMSKMLHKSSFNVTQGAWKVCFMIDLLWH